jgi:hypothetical protein
MHLRLAVALVQLLQLSEYLASGDVFAKQSDKCLLGEHALHTLKVMTDRGRNGLQFVPRTLHYTNIVHPQTNELLDKALVVHMPKPNTHTGLVLPFSHSIYIFRGRNMRISCAR